MRLKKNFDAGFSLVELAIVVFVIGILAIITYVSYNTIQKKVVDISIDSDVQRMAALQTNYKANHGVVGVAYYSGDGTGSVLGFTPKNGNVIDVVINATGYCVRGYNLKGNNSLLSNALTKESSVGACSQIQPSDEAIADSPSGFDIGKQIALGGSHSCALSTGSQVYCWGGNTFGTIGDNSVTERHLPVAIYNSGVLASKTIKSISAGYWHNCVVASDDLPYCWGYNNNGQLGNSSTTQSQVPVAVNTTGLLTGKTVKSIGAAYKSSCVIASDDLLYCWGYNNYGQLGNNSITQSLVPVAVDTTGVLSGITIKTIVTGQGNHVCAISSSNLAYCWGDNSNGQLGNGSYAESHVPVAVTMTGLLSGKTIKTLAVGGYHTCAIASDDLAYCWGKNYSSGQLGNNSTANSLIPVAVDTTGVLNGKTFKSISAGFDYTCAIASDNQAYCWGNNVYGQLGNSSTTKSLVPVAVSTAGVLAGKTIKSIIVSKGNHTCVIASDNQQYCWGYNNYGCLGNNSLTNSTVPVAVLSLP